MIAVNMMAPPAAALSPDDTAAKAVELFAGGAVVLPVTGPDGVLLGAVTPASLLGGPGGMNGMEGTAVTEIMEGDGSARCPAAAPGDPLGSVAERFRDGAGVVFVTDDEGRLLGVITPAEFYGRLWKYSEEKKG